MHILYFVQEFKCLQENFAQLSSDCHYAIGNWTAMESEVSVNQCIFVFMYVHTYLHGCV